MRLHLEDKQAAHTAAALPIDALNKGTQSLETTFRQTFQTKCTATEKSRFCRGYSYLDKLMPCHTKDGNGNCVGIQDKCDMCYNEKEQTNYAWEDYAEMAKQVRHKKWFKTYRPVSLQEMKKFDQSDDTTFMTNFLTDEFPLMDDRFGRLAVKLSQAAHITFRMNFSKIKVLDWSSVCHNASSRGKPA